MESFYKLQTRLALGYFLIVALAGLLLRSVPLFAIDLPYRHWVHMHSHTAMMGWLYIGFTLICTKLYLSHLKPQQFQWIQRSVILSHLSILGMMISFPIQGYGLWSILSSSTLLISAYLFFFFWNRYSREKILGTTPPMSYIALKVSMWYYIVSSLGPWSMGIVKSLYGKESHLYQATLYFYLHFLYNGWALCVVIALVFYWLERHTKTQLQDQPLSRRSFYFLNCAIVLSYATSLISTSPHSIYSVIGGVGVVFYLMSWVSLIYLVKSITSQRSLPLPRVSIYMVIAILFFIKETAQIFSIIPSLAVWFESQSDLIIAYLHWVFLGVLSISWMQFFKELHLCHPGPIFIACYGLGFLFMESSIVLRGLDSITQLNLGMSYHWFIWGGSFILSVAIILLLGSSYQGASKPKVSHLSD